MEVWQPGRSELPLARGVNGRNVLSTFDGGPCAVGASGGESVVLMVQPGKSCLWEVLCGFWKRRVHGKEVGSPRGRETGPYEGFSSDGFKVFSGLLTIP